MAVSPTYRTGASDRNCTQCGEAGKIHGDPQRGLCLRYRHMIGALGVCDDFTRVSWIKRMEKGKG